MSADTKRIQIFKAGRHTSSNGVTADYPVSYLETVAANYNAGTDTHLAPVILGHNPDSGEPAQAWVKRLVVVGDVLEAEVFDVNPEFNSAQYKKVSASFFTDASPNNPTPGSPNLRHVGMLGAASPAVAGLKNAEFSAAPDGVLEFSDSMLTQISLFRSLREWILSKFGSEDADKAVPAYSVDWLQSVETMNQVTEAVEAATAVAGSPSSLPAFSEGAQTAQESSTGDEQAAGNTDVADKAAEAASDAANGSADATQAAAADADQAAQVGSAGAEFAASTTDTGTADFAAREAALAQREAAFAAREAALAQREVSNFCAGLAASGQLLPFQIPQAEKLLASLYGVSATADFAEGQLPVADAFKQFLSGLPKVVSFQEEAPETAAPQAPVADFVAAPGCTVEPEKLKELARLEKVAAERGITLADALRQKL